MIRVLVAILAMLMISTSAADDSPPTRTSLADDSVRFRVPEKPYAVLKRGGVQAVIVDNQAVDDDVLPGHRAGYSGVASLTHERRKENLFVPNYAGLNFEHIHDGTTQQRDILYEPRRAPIQLRVIDEHTAELYQKPTPHWGLESCTRYRLLEDGTLEMAFECIPRRKTFKHGYVGLFWASYIHQPESLDIHFLGVDDGQTMKKPVPKWIRGVTPSHGAKATHVGRSDSRRFAHDDDFPLSLVYNRSDYRYHEPWYYGVSHGMALVQMFRDQDQIRPTQSPSGGGSGNPAWDFQCFLADYAIGRRYQLIMRVMYVPFESRKQIERLSQPHRQALNP